MTRDEGGWAALESALGPQSLVRHDAVDVDGCPFDTSFEPADGDMLARGLGVLGERGRSVVVRGSGSRLALGNRPRDASLLLSMRRFDRIDVLDPEDGVVHAQAGTPLARLCGEAAEAGWELPLEASTGTATLGGVLASGAVGPRVTGFGLPRDVVLGLEVSLPTGERARCGGRVVKNVTGYDLAKLYTGSHGSLCVIEAAWLRLRPRAEAVSHWLVPLERGRLAPLERGGLAPLEPGGVAPRGPDAALDQAVVAASRRPGVRAAVVLNRTAAVAIGAGESACFAVELAGEAPAVEEDADWLSRELGATPVRGDAVGLIDRVADYQAEPLGDLGLRARLAVLPSALAATTRALDAAGFATTTHPGPGLVYARFDATALDAESLAPKLQVLDAAAAGAATSLRFESLPSWAKVDRDVFVADPAAVEIARELKQRFDPRCVLNPGRGAGRL